MKKNLLILTLLMATSVSSVFAQPRKMTSGAAKVTGVDVYFRSGRSDKPTSILQVAGQQCALIPNPAKLERDTQNQEFRPPQTYIYVDYAAHKWYQSAPLAGDTVSSQASFAYGQFQTIGTEQVAGLECKRVRTSVRSNTIDIWYNTTLGFRGTPQPSVGIPDGLVLKITRNGNIQFEATNVQRMIITRNLFPSSWGRMVDEVDFRHTLNQSVVKCIDIFSQDRIAFTGGKAPATIDGSELYTVGGGTVILKKIKLPDSVANMQIFAEISQYSEGDAYDRTGSVFVVPTDRKQSLLDALTTQGISSLPAFVSDTLKYPGIISTADYTVPTELVRFFTPFGIRQFNHQKVKGQVWADSTLYKQDVTHLAPLLKGEVWIGAYIGNWDAKGHILSLQLKYYPDGNASSTAQVLPLFNTVNIMEQGGQTYPDFFGRDSLRVTFTLEKPMTNAKLVYLTTGHGGWGGGDEFNQKVNTIYLDGKKIYTFIPWREDCATYRNLNPSSGNFSNGMSSSDLSRSNWCPGTVTNPVYIPCGNLGVGQHTIAVQIPQGAPDGSSFSYWCVSGTLLGD